MDWNQSTMYEQRVRFILEVQQRTFSFAESFVGATASAGPPDTSGGHGSSRRDSRDSTTALTGPTTARMP